MTKIRLPAIVEAAKKRPLSMDPVTGAFVYYDEVDKGLKKITPLSKLNHEQLIELAVKRQLTNEPDETIVLNGQKFTNEELATEIRNNSKIGHHMFRADIDYLKFYLAQFPEESFSS